MAKEQHVKKEYVYADGTTGRSWKTGATVLRFTFLDTGDIEERRPQDYPDEMLPALAFFGISEKLGNAYANAKNKDESRYEMFASMDEQIMGGTWVAEGEGAGPQISLIVAAIVAAKAKAGIELSVAVVTEKYKALDKAGQKDIREEEAVAVEFRKIKLAKEAERLEKAEAALAASEKTDFEF